MLKKFLGVKLTPAPRVLTDLTFTPTGADILPGQSQTFIVGGKDQDGASMSVALVNAVSSTTPGLTFAKSGATFTVKAPAVYAGPAAGVPVTIDVDAD